MHQFLPPLVMTLIWRMLVVSLGRC
jgi:hypothetical protein